MKKNIFFLIYISIYFLGCASKNTELSNKKFFQDNSKFLNDTSLILSKISNKTSLNIKSIKEYDTNNKLIFETTPDKNNNQILCNNGYKLIVYFSNGQLYKTKCKNIVVLNKNKIKK